MVPRFLALTARVLFTCSAPLWAEWRNIGPGGGGWLPCMAVSPHDSRVVYAGCDVGGFFKSVNAGASWRICNAGLHDLYVEVIVPHPRDPRVVFIGTEGGVHRSADGGQTWQRLGEGFPPPQRYRFSAPIGALAVDPQNPDVLYAGIGQPRWDKGGRGMVYKTTDGGARWQIANTSGGGIETNAIISDLLVHPREGRRVFAATNRGLYRSDDAGATWRRLEKGLPHPHTRRVALCLNRPEILYVTLHSTPGRQPWQGGVYRSDDGGETWSPRLQGLGNRVGRPGDPAPITSNVDRLAVHPDNPDIAYAGDRAWTTAGVYRTTDGGQSWRRVTNPRVAELDDVWITMWGPTVMGMAMDPRAPDTLCFSTSGYIFRTTDRGERWQQIYTKRAKPPAGAPDSPTGYWSTTGLEATCQNAIVVHPRDPKRLYLCYADIGLMQSFDGGRTFTRTVQGMKNNANTFTVAFDPGDPRIVFAGTGWWNRNAGDVCRSDDGGMTWTVVGKPETGLPDGQTRHLLVDRDSPPSARRIYATVNERGIFCSEDGGASWQARNNGLPSGAVRGLAQHPREPHSLYALLGGANDDRGGVYRSDDRGGSWRRVGNSFRCPDARAIVMAPSDPGRLYVAARERRWTDRKTYPGGLFASRDGGDTWEQVLDDPFIEGVAVDPRDASVVYAGGTDHPYHDNALGRGVLRSRDGGRTWESLNTPALTCRKISCLTVDPHRPTRLYAGTGGNGAFVWQE